MEPPDLSVGGSLLGQKRATGSPSGQQRLPEDQETTDGSAVLPAAGATTGGAQPRRPVIIHSVSPRVIHNAGDFMDLVQRLTGDFMPFQREDLPHLR
ncbi:hypothetical protein LguiA_026947 [Lonicera macranthoides]